MSDYYNKIKEIVDNFLKNKYWNNFTNSDIFYITKKGRKYVSSFISNFYGDSFGIQIYNNNDGLNYLSDLFTESDEEINLVKEYEADALCVILTDQVDLVDEEIKYLELSKQEIKKSNNLILYRFESGYGRRFADKKEEKQIYDFLVMLGDIISNDYKLLINNFKSEESAIIDVLDYNNYLINFDELPYLETKITNAKVHENALYSLKEMKKENDTCFINVIYSPIVIEETNVRPILLYFYFESGKHQLMRYLNCEKKDYQEEFLNILLDVFDEYHLPSEIYINNKRFTSLIKRTFKEAKIFVDYHFDDDISEQIIDSITNVFHIDLEIKDNSEKVNETLKSICEFVNTITSAPLDEEDEYIDDDMEDENHYVS